MYKVGDRVRYLGAVYPEDESYNNRHFNRGGVYTVSRASRVKGVFVVSGKSNNNRAYLCEGEFELASEEILDVEELL